MPDDAEGLKELAERLLTHPHPDGPTSVELFPGRLPGAWGEVPAPTGARLLGSAMHMRRDRPAVVEAVFDGEADSMALIARYETELGRSGWNALEAFGGMHGGFMPGGMMGLGRAFRRGDEGPILMVSAIDREGGTTDLRMRLDWEMARHLPEMRHHHPEGSDKIPPLHPPPGVPLRGGGGGGGSGTWHSTATIETEMPPVDVESHFARQLERAGWARAAGSGDGIAAWSSWHLPGQGDWRGILLVLAAFAAGERFLYVWVAGDDSGAGGYGSSMTLRSRG
jgi:hypothetical protein